ncbi:MAG TPA: hypothetical protein VK021_03750 [Flavobacteriaceae bacterium]|nr:hypothetical protein [Flavobacteriaceae bacterium]
MKTASLIDGIVYHEIKPVLQVLLNSDSGKEIRIVFKKDQVMERHQTPFPIVVEVFDGAINFGIRDEEKILMKTGDLISLKGGIPHDLKAVEDSIVRLSLVKSDSVSRVKEVVDK